MANIDTAALEDWIIEHKAGFEEGGVFKPHRGSHAKGPVVLPEGATVQIDLGTGLHYGDVSKARELPGGKLIQYRFRRTPSLTLRGPLTAAELLVEVSRAIALEVGRNVCMQRKLSHDHALLERYEFDAKQPVDGVPVLDFTAPDTACEGELLDCAEEMRYGGTRAFDRILRLQAAPGSDQAGAATEPCRYAVAWQAGAPFGG